MPDSELSPLDLLSEYERDVPTGLSPTPVKYGRWGPRGSEVAFDKDGKLIFDEYLRCFVFFSRNHSYFTIFDYIQILLFIYLELEFFIIYTFLKHYGPSFSKAWQFSANMLRKHK